MYKDNIEGKASQVKDQPQEEASDNSDMKAWGRVEPMKRIVYQEAGQIKDKI